MDTLRNITYIFDVMSEQEEGNPYRDEIFMIVTYFVNKLMMVRTSSVQEKFEGMFKNNSGCQNFFSKMNQYLRTQIQKTEKGTLMSFLARMRYTDELSAKSYYVDKNLEKQIVTFMRLLCKNANGFMQNYLKKQNNNSRSFNMIAMVNELSIQSMNHLHFPVAFDTFVACLRCLLEMIQGPNQTNQNFLIFNDFVKQVAVPILDMRYHDNEKDMASMVRRQLEDVNKSGSITIRKSRTEFPSISIGKSKFRTLAGDVNVTIPSSNYMVSLAKYWTLLLLNNLTNGFEIDDYVYYLYRREIDPDIFRNVFAYQQYFFAKKYHSQYKTDLFFTYTGNMNKEDRSPFIVEIGFECYFLLKKLEENVRLDYDERYVKRILKLLPKWDKPQIQTTHNILLETFHFFRDVFRALTACCFRRSQEVNFNDIKKMSQNDHVVRNVLNFYENNSAQIEILKNGDLQEFWFPRMPYCVFKSNDVKDEFIENVNRTNAKTKCENLQRSSKVMIVVLKIDYWLRNNMGKFMGILIEYIELWKNYLAILAVVINVLIILTYNSDSSRLDDPTIGDLDSTQTEILLRGLGAINLLLAFIVVGVLLFQRIPYNYQKYRVREQDMKKRIKDSGMIINEDISDKALKKVTGAYEVTKLIFTDKLILYHTLYFIFAILGVAFHPFFLAFCLTYLIVRSSVLINVLKAAYEPRYQIIYTLFLFVVVYYIFSIFSYMIFHTDYNESLENACHSLWGCLFVTIDQSYKNDGAIGGFLPVPFSPSGSDLEVEWGRVFYDYIFNFIVAILLTEILSGIIIDKFSELREANEEIEKDNNSLCFVCDQEREDLEKELGYNGFRYHTLFEHNVWDYLFFMAYIKHKKTSSVNDYLELERYVMEKLNSEQTNWMPCYYDYDAEEEEEQQGFKDDDRVLLQQILLDLKAIKLSNAE
jgi:inositol 1,4,5-triphosphate receptor type 1/inositol 1,4,5-triphosphate receptor type 3